ncbi:hypothetical protein CHS0354_033726 [Potamilus streckersoni]|uniref:Uncharacterized protein n=1 Tax=Potamilus streckersoni TaxID=2493646 RepID=A0AAE0S238_9BIVA|nr:hypothetical protein CHS0354_033726 [Potamilus streckersoni]
MWASSKFNDFIRMFRHNNKHNKTEHVYHPCIYIFSRVKLLKMYTKDSKGIKLKVTLRNFTGARQEHHIVPELPPPDACSIQNLCGIRGLNVPSLAEIIMERVEHKSFKDAENCYICDRELHANR